MRRITLAATVLTGILYADNTTLLPYGAYIDYQDSTRDNAYSAGIYSSTKVERTLLEAAIGYMRLDYKTGSPQSYYKQYDMTFMGNYYYQNNWTIKGGLHNIWSKTDLSATTYDPVWKVGLQYYQYLQYDIEGDLYLSNYDNFNVYQASLKYGQSFGIEAFPHHSFYLATTLHQIHLTKDGYAPKKNYTNVDLQLNIYDAAWMATLKASLGKNTYKVANDGWVVYNLGEEYKYNMGVEWRYYLTPLSNLNIGYQRSKFNESTTYDSYANTFLLTYTMLF